VAQVQVLESIVQYAKKLAPPSNISIFIYQANIIHDYDYGTHTRVCYNQQCNLLTSARGSGRQEKYERVYSMQGPREEKFEQSRTKPPRQVRRLQPRQKRRWA